ncbi:GNAT family N-acetyltransferase [Ruminococcus sp.]|uniref:GNAT family N-acetyltransferase n=1 Tax=Ruminococcus sp. TaxID=41978 RepID=UPI0025E15F8A|nr:GNAT family N-acetyltransferase [Ruminococcus sp.]MCI6615760.1 GNAT family N-acetyltransferase [Ruminococcus sp.]
MIIFKVTNNLSEDEKFIRETVFIEEQNFKVEFDDTDDIATHIVMYLDNQPVGCCRLYKQENEYHIGRIAVLKPYRGKGYGEKILLNAERVAKEKGADSISLSAQVRASGFYEKLGYKKHGEIYFDEYCEHIAMKKDI